MDFWVWGYSELRYWNQFTHLPVYPFTHLDRQRQNMISFVKAATSAEVSNVGRKKKHISLLICTCPKCVTYNPQDDQFAVIWYRNALITRISANYFLWLISAAFNQVTRQQLKCMLYLNWKRLTDDTDHFIGRGPIVTGREGDGFQYIWHVCWCNLSLEHLEIKIITFGTQRKAENQLSIWWWNYNLSNWYIVFSALTSPPLFPRFNEDVELWQLLLCSHCCCASCACGFGFVCLCGLERRHA